MFPVLMVAMFAAQPTPPRCLAVEVDPEVGHVRAGQIVHALRLRTFNDRLRVRRSCTHRADWVVRVVRLAHIDQLYVAMEAWQGALIHESWFDVGEREAQEVAHTVSLKVIETLAPLAPELLTTAPDDRPEVLAELPPRVEAEKPRSWAVGVGASTLVSWPQARASFGVTVHLETDRSGFLMVGDASWWSPIERNGSGYELRVHQAGVRVGVGKRLQLGGIWLSLTGGVLGRAAFIRARGEDVEADQTWLVDPGLDVQASTSILAGPVRVGLAVSFGVILRNPQLMVDNAGVVEVGHLLAKAALRVAYPW